MQKLLKVFPIGMAASLESPRKKEKNSINHFKKVISPVLEKQMS